MNYATKLILRGIDPVRERRIRAELPLTLLVNMTTEAPSFVGDTTLYVFTTTRLEALKVKQHFERALRRTGYAGASRIHSLRPPGDAA